jgi:hypothetical protein
MGGGGKPTDGCSWVSGWALFMPFFFFAGIFFLKFW